MGMLLLSWTPFIFSRNGFPRDENGSPFLPGNTITDAIKTAVVFYFIKKDKEIENKIKKYMLKEGLNPADIVKDIRNIVFEKHPILSDLKVQEKIYLNPEKITQEYVEVFDLKEWIDIRGFRTEIYKNNLEVDIQSSNLDKIKAACHSYAEALARIEHSMLKDHPLASIFYEPLLNELKNWEIPLRIGLWTEVRFGGNLLFFWRIKEVREKLIKQLKIDIRPRYVLYFPREKKTAGWSELRKQI